MNTIFWSRRRVLGALAAGTAVAATSSLVLNRAAAWAETLPAAEGPPPNLPDTDRGKAVWAYKTGGKAVREAAVAALTGTPAALTGFLTTHLPTARAEDNRFGLITSLPYAGRAVRTSANTALGAGDDAISAYLAGGYAGDLHEDLRQAVFTVLNNSGRAVQREANKALTTDTQAALKTFLTEGRFTAQEEDDRVALFRILSTASPEVRKYAQRALNDGSPDAIRTFLSSGQHIARARDEEAATIDQLVAIVEREGKIAGLRTEQAVAASDKAKEAAEKAKAAALKAAEEARAAQNDVAKSAKAANAAASAAQGAASAANRAIAASRTAQNAASRAASAAQAAAAAAATAGNAAARAYHAAIAASKDAGKAEAANLAAQGAKAAAAKARTAAKAADQASIASRSAASAGASAASAAQNAAAAAGASADAAASAGVAQSQAAAAQAAAAEADAAAARATKAANTAQTLANRAADAAATARDAANSAATHAEKAALAAEDAYANAGEAIEYATRSTEYANAAVAAANNAYDAVTEAKAVEQAARDAETARLAEEVELGIVIARSKAKAETDDAARADRERTEADRTSSAIKDLIAAAETALRSGDTAKAVTDGRNAAAKLLTATGTWTREAAEFALAGNDDDVLRWLDADRGLAQRLDDRETVLAVARMSTADIAQAAHTALASTDEDAPTRFLASGAIQAGVEEYRVRIFKLLNENPGTAVRTKAQAALDNGSAIAMHRFLSLELAEAVKEDDNVEVLRLLNTGGPYMQAAAKIALEGSARMRRSFVTSGQFHAARLDHDHATHVAAIRASIAHASKVALKALEDAARASKAAAEARAAADDATYWSNKADGYYKDALASSEEAKQNADAADASAQKAAESAAAAKKAASVARAASRSANYSMSQALTSAKEAVSYASQAQASAAQAQADAIAAGKSQAEAAAAASAAKKIVADKRKAEAEAKAQTIAMEAAAYKTSGTTPVDKDGDTKYWGMWPEDIGDGKDWHETLGHWSTVTGVAAAGLAIASIWCPALLPVAGAVGLVSWALGGAQVLTAYGAYGPESNDFKEDLAEFAVGTIFMGKGAIMEKFGQLDHVGGRISEALGGAAGGIMDILDW